MFDESDEEEKDPNKRSFNSTIGGRYVLEEEDWETISEAKAWFENEPNAPAAVGRILAVIDATSTRPNTPEENKAFWEGWFKRMDEYHQSDEYKAQQQEDADKRRKAKDDRQPNYPYSYQAKQLGKVIRVQADNTVTMGQILAGKYVPETEPLCIILKGGGALPEQYDGTIHLADGTSIKRGYLRLRHGSFRIDYPEACDETIHTDHACGDGEFEYDEREEFLDLSRAYIYERYLKEIETGDTGRDMSTRLEYHSDD